ncbi:MAG: Ni/Fe hydrogenase subunit alpha [Chloroflexaceae bacterium]
MKSKTTTIKVDYLARVEGEGGLYVKVKDKNVTDVQLRIFEPPRFFEAFLLGRDYGEVPDITARIWGICPVAYQMSSVHAMENAFGVKVEGPLRELRRLIYCGEWIESHVLHFSMLHAPDFLGYPDAIQMAKDHPEIVQAALKLKKAGNDIVTFIGGREIHPINVRVGGFYKVPTRRELKRRLKDQLEEAREIAKVAVDWTASLPCPDFERDYEYVALQHPDEYPYNEGRLVSNKGLDIDIYEYPDYFAEEHVAHSTALHSVLKARGAYHVGPLARYNLNFDRLSPMAQEAARNVGLGSQCYNPFKSIVVRAVETLYACDEALRIIDSYEMPDEPAVKVEPRAGVGHGCSEAPRGILYHRYRIDDEGNIRDARIIPPTSQNQKTIENDLWQFVPQNINTAHDKLTWQCEQVIRNYDPCISCSTHFLKLHIEQE